MIALVDSGIWIDFFHDRDTPQTRALHDITAAGGRLLVGDVVLIEVLQGTRSDRDFVRTAARMRLFDQIRIVDRSVATQGARHYRQLRSLGITIRKTIDTLIATRCILDGIPLLYADRDFDPFVRHLGLRSALDLSTGAP